ncbi:MAG: SCO family protein [Gammaproteobacteria bacterium]|nr:SCO family protein [Gammaproteobacteria bacterium]
MASTTDNSSASSRARLKLLGLAMVFAAPLLAAVVLYAFSDWLPLPAPVSNGELISPPRAIKEFELQTVNGRRLTRGFLRDKWTLLYVGGSHCDLWCEASLFKMRQVRLSLGRDQSRVQRLYVLTDTKALRSLRPLLRRHAGMMVAQAQGNNTLRPLSAHPSGTFFLVDPHGNLMMRYAPRDTARGLQDDLDHLLEASRIG